MNKETNNEAPDTPASKAHGIHASGTPDTSAPASEAHDTLAPSTPDTPTLAPCISGTPDTSGAPALASAPCAHPVFPKDAKLSDQLAYLHAVFANKPMQLRDMTGVLGEHAPLLLIILLALPFAIPWPLPLSMPFGLAIVFVAVALLRGKPPRFSEKILNARFPVGVHGRLVRFSKRITGWLERWMRPGRWAFVFGKKQHGRLHAAGLLLAALFLASPLPFSNFLPAWAIILVAAGLLGRDGFLVMLGHLFFLAGLLCVALLGAGVAVTFEALKNWFTGLF